MPTMQQNIQHKIARATVEKGLAPRTFRVTISSGAVDRDGDTIPPESWDFSEYRRNPIVLFGHDTKSLPVARTIDIGVVRGMVQATAEFPPPGTYGFADTVHDMLKGGFISAASVGFIAHEAAPNGWGGKNITKARLCEWSFVAVGSNPDARVERAAPVAMQKWLQSKSQFKEDAMDTEIYLEVSDDFVLKTTTTEEAFDEMCARMLANYSEMDSAKFRQLMAAQLSLLGPNATIDQLVRGIMRDSVVPPQSFDVDERELAATIAKVIADETGTQVRAAFNAALGRLD